MKISEEGMLDLGHLKFKVHMNEGALTWGMYATTEDGLKLFACGLVNKATATEFRLISQHIQDEFEVIE